MRRFPILLAVLLMAATACGGGSKSSKSANAAPSPNQIFGETDDGRPGWINRGSVAVTTADGRRMFFGVGIGQNIRNPALLRSTTDNRARNELAKVFEVYSASLMKDFMSSSSDGEEVQNVEQAIKTMTSSSLKGVEVVDRYIGDDGSMYSLAQLDLVRAMAAVKAAEDAGAVRNHVTKVSPEDIFDKHGKKETPVDEKPPVVARDDSPPPPSAGTPPPPPPSKDPPRTGKRPDWIDGPDSRFPGNRYLCGVGFSTDRAIAENGAYAALSRIFVAHVSSISKDFMGAYSKTGAESVEVQSVENLTRVATEKVFTGVRIYEVYKDKDSTIYALACIERDKAGADLRRQIAEADARARRYLDKAAAADKASRLGYLGKAMDAILEIAAINGELRIIDASGVGVAVEFSHVDISAALEETQEALKVGVKIEGAYKDDFRGAFINGLSKRGYNISDDANVDVLVTVKVRVEDEGKGTGKDNWIHYVRVTINYEIKNVATNKVIDADSANKKQGERSKNNAELKAVRTLGKKISKKVGAKIDKAMKGG